jgi:hypothetical protein
VFASLLPEAVEDGSNDALHHAVNLRLTVQVHHPVQEHGGQSMHGRPDHSIRARSGRLRQAARNNQPVKLRRQQVVGVRRDRWAGFGATHPEGETGNCGIVQGPSNIAAPEGHDALLRIIACSRDGSAQAFPQSGQHTV